MRKTVKKLFMMAALIVGVMLANVTAYADTGKTTIAVSSDTINIGDKVTVTGKAKTSGGNTAYATMTLSYDSNVLELVSCTATYGGGGGTVSVSVDTFSVTFKAIASGKTKLSISAADGVDFSSGEELDSVEGCSTSITVNNKASEEEKDSDSNKSDEDKKDSDSKKDNTSESENADSSKKLSADNSLKTLTISPGSLSPEFKGNTTKYTATVANDVTSIAVSATPVNANATVESVTGNTNLSVGVNQIQIVVKAENGTTATYKIDVTRAAEAAAVTENTTTSETGESEEAESTEDTETESEESTEASGEAQQATFSVNENSYVTATLPPEGETLPAGYTQTEITLENGMKFTAFSEPAAEDAAAEFYLFYGVNAAGVGSWYRYDSVEGTYQRTTVSAAEENMDESDVEYLQNNYNALLEKYKSEKDFTRNAIAVMVFVGAVLVIVIINMALYIRRVRMDDEDDDFDEDEEKESSAEAIRRAYREQKAAEKAKAAERAKAKEMAQTREEMESYKAKERTERVRRSAINDDLEDEDELEDTSFGWKKRTWEEDSLEEIPEKKKEIKKKTSSGRVEVEDFNDF